MCPEGSYGEKNVDEIVLVWISLSDFQQSFRNLILLFPVLLSILQSTCANDPLGNENLFQYSSLYLEEILDDKQNQFFSAGWSKLALTCTDDHSAKNEICRIKNVLLSFLTLRVEKIRIFRVKNPLSAETLSYVVVESIWRIF